MGYYNHYIIAVKTRSELKNLINCRNQCLQLLRHLFFTNCACSVDLICTYRHTILGSLLSNYFESKKNKPTNKRNNKEKNKNKTICAIPAFFTT